MPVYIAEVAPFASRGGLAYLFQVATTVGILAAQVPLLLAGALLVLLLWLLVLLLWQCYCYCCCNCQRGALPW